MFSVKTSSSGTPTEDSLEQMAKTDPLVILDQYAKMGVDLLSSATPVLSGLAASSWFYRIESHNGVYVVSWHNDDIEGGASVVILIQYGHATGTGGYVQGRDFINPAMRPVFDSFVNDMWRGVRNA